MATAQVAMPEEERKETQNIFNFFGYSNVFTLWRKCPSTKESAPSCGGSSFVFLIHYQKCALKVSDRHGASGNFNKETKKVRQGNVLFQRRERREVAQTLHSGRSNCRSCVGIGLHTLGAVPEAADASSGPRLKARPSTDGEAQQQPKRNRKKRSTNQSRLAERQNRTALCREPPTTPMSVFCHRCGES